MGVGRLFAEPELLDGVTAIDVVLTHWHLDHVAGLGFLTLHHAGVKPTVWGPGAAVMGVPAADILGRVLGPPFFSRTAEAAQRRFADVRDLEEGAVEVGGFPLQLRVQQRHSTPTLAIRLGDVFALCTDTGYDEGNVGFAGGVHTLLHEAVYAADRCPDEWHSAGGDA